MSLVRELGVARETFIKYMNKYPEDFEKDIVNLRAIKIKVKIPLSEIKTKYNSMVEEGRKSNVVRLNLLKKKLQT
jgi:hypothetical protein